MSIERDIFDIDGALEAAFEADLNMLEIAVRIPNSDPAFQLERSRVEVFVKLGKWLGTLKPEMGKESAPGSMRETYFDGEMSAVAITRADGEVHNTFRAAVRNRMSKCIGRLNKTLLTRHKLHWVETVGSAPDYVSNKGYFETTLNYRLKVSIQDDAWAALDAEEGQQATIVPYFIQCDTGGAFQLSAALANDGTATFSAIGDNIVKPDKTLLPNDSDGLFYEYRCRAVNDLYLAQDASEEKDWTGVYFQFGVNVYQMRCRTELDQNNNATVVPYLKLIVA